MARLGSPNNKPIDFQHELTPPAPFNYKCLPPARSLVHTLVCMSCKAPPPPLGHLGTCKCNCSAHLRSRTRTSTETARLWLAVARPLGVGVRPFARTGGAHLQVGETARLLARPRALGLRPIQGSGCVTQALVQEWTRLLLIEVRACDTISRACSRYCPGERELVACGRDPIDWACEFESLAS